MLGGLPRDFSRQKLFQGCSYKSFENINRNLSHLCIRLEGVYRKTRLAPEQTLHILPKFNQDPHLSISETLSVLRLVSKLSPIEIG